MTSTSLMSHSKADKFEESNRAARGKGKLGMSAPSGGVGGVAEWGQSTVTYIVPGWDCQGASYCPYYCGCHSSPNPAPRSHLAEAGLEQLSDSEPIPCQPTRCRKTGQNKFWRPKEWVNKKWIVFYLDYLSSHSVLGVHFFRLSFSFLSRKLC